jgi:protein gp37
VSEQTAPVTHRTWNPWRGCTRVSAGCLNCYMFRQQREYGRDPAVVVRTKTWGDPPKWQRVAARAGRRELVFTCSWSDWFHEAADPWRDEAWAVVKKCPNLTFQVLTKRPERIKDHLPSDWGAGYENVWLGASIERDDYCGRADVLRAVPTKVRWICAEPLLGPLPSLNLDGIHWVVCGGESGPDWRPMETAWARGLREKCRAAGVPFYFKQSNGLYPGTAPRLDGELVHEMPAVPRIPLGLFE